MASAPTSNPWFAATLGLAGLIAGYVIANGMNGLAVQNSLPAGTTPPTAQNTPPPPAAQSDPASVDDDPMLGSDSATVTLIEFTDYQCPFCSRHYEQTYGQIKADYIDTGKVKYVVRDYPLSFHPNAQKAAEASECANDQGKFWEMHDTLFESQPEWSNSADAQTTFTQYASDLGLDADEFGTCLSSGAKAQEVAADLSAGSQSGISGTPGFWVVGPDGTGQMIEGAYPYETFKAAFDSYLN